jgi:hypothetical protein
MERGQGFFYWGSEDEPYFVCVKCGIEYDIAKLIELKAEVKELKSYIALLESERMIG